MKLRLGFRAFDPHELLLHFIAERIGAYAALGLEIELVDLRGSDAAHDATVACGAALLEALGGAPVRIVFIASAAPLFWLYGRADGGRCGRVATYPPGAPPGKLLALALERETIFVAAPNDEARLGLLRAGETDCALLSSATPPSRLGDLAPRFCLAERVPVPTTGIATTAGAEIAVRPLVDAHRSALASLREDVSSATEVAEAAFAFTRQEADWAVAVARRHFSADGRVRAEYAIAAVSLLGGASSPYAPQALA